MKKHKEGMLLDSRNIQRITIIETLYIMLTLVFANYINDQKNLEEKKQNTSIRSLTR